MMSIKPDFPALLTFVAIAFVWTWSVLWVGADILSPA
jgi:hypothetical protein